MTLQQQFESGRSHHQAGRLVEAEKIYRQILARQPNHADALNLLGVLAVQVGQSQLAVELIRRATAICSTNAFYHGNLGNALTELGQLDQAIASYRQAVWLLPESADVHYNLGIALQRKGQLDEAIAAYRQAVRINPDYAEAHYNLGIAFKDQRRIDEAIASYRQVIRLKPDDARTHNNLALALLTRGDFQQGWEEHEWRWKCKDFPSPARNFAQPQWDGCPLENRTILLHAEQGVGDAIQFIRYVPLVARRGGRIIIECDTELQRLFRTMAVTYQIVPPSQPPPPFDFHCPLLSLPRVFGTNLANIPKDVPYLHADAEDVGRWQHRLAEHSPLVKVGLGWAGSPAHKNDRNRSMKLATLAPLGQLPGVRFFSLQKGAAAAEAKTSPPGMKLVDWTEELKDFADTATLISNLDLVIAVDTAVAHLAGAMDKPVWTLLPFASDWRWLLERQDSPWYPTMRLFRQPSRGDWDSVIARVGEALSLWIKNRP
ncbi:MAG: tetratricopeptide repeat-containing glycosyltransferase family protein [Tepidisphaeraceae bacterium]|jgi:Flp pilus assembly protein TadD